MADVKISALPASTTPLTGAEVLPIVQSGTTKKVSVANLTAGRSISVANLTASTGNVIIGTSGQGVDFSITSSGSGTMTSELLADYEEGNWTPIDQSDGGLTFSNSYGTYTKVGRVVLANVIVVYPTTASTASVLIGGLPYAVANTNGIYSPSRGGGSVVYSDAGISMYANLSQGATQFYMYNQTSGANITNNVVSGKVIRLMFVYPTT